MLWLWYDFMVIWYILSLFGTFSEENLATPAEQAWRAQFFQLSISGKRQILFSARVTRLGEFSPNAPFFYFGQFFENYRISTYFGTTFSAVKVMYSF
jgi:hypothetical protein